MNDTRVIVQVAIVSDGTIKFGQAYQLLGGMMTPSTPQDALKMIDLDLKGGRFPLVNTDQPPPNVIEYGGVRYVQER